MLINIKQLNQKTNDILKFYRWNSIKKCHMKTCDLTFWSINIEIKSSPRKMNKKGHTDNKNLFTSFS